MCGAHDFDIAQLQVTPMNVRGEVMFAAIYLGYYCLAQCRCASAS